MEKNKRFISILTVCLLSVLAVLPLFSVTVSASGSVTDETYYYPQTSITISVSGIGTTDYVGEHLHFPLTYYSGHEFTSNYNSVGVYDNDALYSAVLVIDQYTPPTLEDGYWLIPQSSMVTFDQYDQTIMNEVTFTIRNLYVFDKYFEDFPSNVTSSFWGEVSTEDSGPLPWGFYSSSQNGSLYCRYREVGDELYTEVKSTSESFAPYMDTAVDADGSLSFNPGDYNNPTHSFRFDEYTKLPFFEEEKLYHIDELSLTFYTPMFSLDEFIFDFRYYNVHGIDNIVITNDMSNVDLPLRDFTSWLGTATSGFFTAEIAPGFSLGGIVMMCLAFALVIWFLKIFAGG